MILALNTSTDPYKFALYSPGKLEKEFEGLREDNKDVLFFIDQFLKENNIKLQELEAIAVFRGPGSYTGLRAGISIANTLSFVLGIPIFGFAGSRYQEGTFEIAQKAYKKIKKKRAKSISLIKPIY